MSLNESLVTSQHDFELFAASWQAGLSGSQYLTKSLRKYDIEGVNILKICEKLNLVLKENAKSLFAISNDIDDGKQCTVTKSCVSFRTFSNIWFGTLKIYQQQVNTLLRLSQDLFSHSRFQKVKLLENRKRMTSAPSNKVVKRRRMTMREAEENTYFPTNYSELLYDLETLTQGSRLKDSLEEFSRSNNIGEISQFQIREITICEINATTLTSADADEDSQFGEATQEEIEEFFNFVEEDNSISYRKNKSVKRKSSCNEGSPPNIFSNSLFETPNNENLTPYAPISETSFSKSPNITTTIASGFDKNRPIENLKTSEENYDIKIDFIEADKIKNEKLLLIENKKILKKGNGRVNLIIDKCTKIDIEDIIEKIKTSEVMTNLERKKILKSYKIKKKSTALELLTCFNRKPSTLTLSRKQKLYLTREQFERDYLNLLREIFKTKYNEELASEIYPKWNSFKNVIESKTTKQIINKSRKQTSFTKQQEADINTPTDDYFEEFERIPTTTNYSKLIKLNTCIFNDWHPCGVMEKLLGLWRFNQTTKIAAKTLFKLTGMQIDRALGFNSLLNLYQKQFVCLTSFPKSIELQNILIGKAIKSDIINNFTL